MSASSLGQRVMSGQLAPFLPDDFYYVVDKTSRSPDRLVLVGGHRVVAVFSFNIVSATSADTT